MNNGSMNNVARATNQEPHDKPQQGSGQRLSGPIERPPQRRHAAPKRTQDDRDLHRPTRGQAAGTAAAGPKSKNPGIPGPFGTQEPNITEIIGRWGYRRRSFVNLGAGKSARSRAARARANAVAPAGRGASRRAASRSGDEHRRAQAATDAASPGEVSWRASNERSAELRRGIRPVQQLLRSRSEPRVAIGPAQASNRAGPSVRQAQTKKVPPGRRHLQCVRASSRSGYSA